MNQNKEFGKWFEEYFKDTQGEDSPYTYNDVRKAFFAGFRTGKKKLTPNSSKKAK